MSDISNPHDRFFKEMFSRLEVARDFLHHNLPPQIRCNLDLDHLVLKKDSYIDDHLHEHFSDLLFLTRLKDSNEAYIYLLFEHKSYPEPLVAFHLLRYMVQIWDQDIKEKVGKPFRPVIPLVVYHGLNKWTISTRFADLFPKSGIMKAYTPSFEYLLFDLPRMADDAIMGEKELLMAILLMKYIYSGELKHKLDEIFELIRLLKDEKSIQNNLKIVINYLIRSTDKVDQNEIHESLTRVKVPGGIDIMPTIAEQWLKEGHQIGIEEGIEEGIEIGVEIGVEIGKIEMILEIRFGSISPRINEILKKENDLNRLREWREIALKISSIDELEKKILS